MGGVPGIGAIGKNHRRRHAWNQYGSSNTDIESLSRSIDSMSMGTDPSDESYPHDIHGTPQFDWATQNIFQYPLSQMLHGGPNMYQQCDGWVNPHCPIHGITVGRDRGTYEWHVHDYTQNHFNVMSWYQYCLNQDGMPSFLFEPARNSFWY